jgi:integrase
VTQCRYVNGLWKTAAGEERQAWLCDYTGQSGKRHVKTFARKKDADAFIAKAKVEVREGIHTADSDSVTIRDAADLWLTTGAARGLERATLAAYEQHARLHIFPSLGRMKLSRLSAPAVRDFEDRLRTDGRSAAMIRKILTSLGSMLSDAQGARARLPQCLPGSWLPPASTAGRTGARRAA